MFTNTYVTDFALSILVPNERGSIVTFHTNFFKAPHEARDHVFRIPLGKSLLSLVYNYYPACHSGRLIELFVNHLKDT